MKTQDAVNYFGSKAALADVLGLTYAAVCTWGENIPSQRAYEVQDLTKGELKYGGKFSLLDREKADEYREKVLADAEWKAKGRK